MRVVVLVPLILSASSLFAQAQEESQEWRGKELIEEVNAVKEYGHGPEYRDELFKDGGVGKWTAHAKVLQVVNDKEAHVELTPWVQRTITAGTQSVVDWELASSGWRTIIRGFDFSKYADGMEYEFPGPMQFVKMETYSTAIGSSNRVPVFEPAVKGKLKLPCLRTWTSSVGSTLEAQFYSYESGDLTLMRPDGSLVKLELKQLSDEDQKHVRDLIVKAKDAEREKRKEEALKRRPTQSK
jgi:hypothetical protein